MAYGALSQLCQGVFTLYDQNFLRLQITGRGCDLPRLQYCVDFVLFNLFYLEVSNGEPVSGQFQEFHCVFLE